MRKSAFINISNIIPHGIKHTLLCATLFILYSSTPIWAQEAFNGYLYNDDHHIYMRISLEKEDVIAPGHELYGEIPGYLAREGNAFYWLITSAEVVNGKKATLSMINDYGTEDLKATLTMKNDSTFTLTQGSGSTIKVPEDGKWKKLPKNIDLIKRTPKKKGLRK